MQKTTKADFLREISNMPSILKLIAEYIGALTKDFSSPNLDIKRIPLKAAHIYALYLFSSTYKPLGSGSNSISNRDTV